MNIGVAIKENRKKKGIKQFELAEKCLISPTYLNLIENNRKQPSIELLNRISSELGLPTPLLMFLSLDTEDIPDSKRGIFEVSKPAIDLLIRELFR